MLPFGLTISEALGLTSLAYVLAIAAFNAGYFSSVPSRFVELFSFGDIVNSNIPILQYILALYFSYIVLAPIVYLVFLLPKKLVEAGIERGVTRRSLPSWTFDAIDLAAFIMLGMGCLLITYELDKAQNTIFSLEFIPWAALYTFIFQDFRIRYSKKHITLRTFMIQAAINATVFCYTTGRMWIKYELRAPADVQAIYSQSGCMDRKLLRSTSSGYLLYSPTLKQFEFRDKGEIKVIYDRQGCT